MNDNKEAIEFVRREIEFYEEKVKQLKTRLEELERSEEE